MNQYPVAFEFTSYEFNPTERRVVFNYTTTFKKGDPILFTETIILPETPNIHAKEKLVQKILESLHIILGISYYKFYCAPKLVLPYQLSKKESDFWNIVWRKGLGEFFYRSGLHLKNSPKFPYSKNATPASYTLLENARCLVGIGGGKDSLVSIELLKQKHFDITLFNVETKLSPLLSNVSATIGEPELKIQRQLDQKVFAKHLYNGHIPISAIYAFLGLLSGVLYGYSYIVVSNEHSSNFGNLEYEGEIINHQWSKSLEFEQMLQEYTRDFLTPSIHYFSLLRPFYEIRIAKLFSQIGKKYFNQFSSCNRNFSSTNPLTQGLWCGQCPKCVFVFTLLSAFLSKKELTDILKKNLYQDGSLLPLFNDTLGFGNIKPFDCVGTFQEAQTALYLARGKFKNDVIVKKLGKKVKYRPEVFQAQRDSLVPDAFKFLGMERALILGYGKEGRVTEQYLKKYYPKVKIGIADQSQGKSYLKKQVGFDIAIKTPLIKKEQVLIPYTTATNIFFSEVKGNNLIIGVTGSKGKSTTATLIYEILKAAGKKVELLGNIGKPMLERLLEPISRDTMFVLELSSYQLDDIHFSPDIAVVTNLFEEHMDYHGSASAYFEAKKNIINFQKKDNYFVYDPKNKIMKSWLKNYPGKATAITDKYFETQLLGEHNQNNIRAAIAVADILGIKTEVARGVVKSFKNLPHRLEFVGEFSGIKFYDDAISTTPDSTIMALKALKQVDTIFLGGEDRGYHFSELQKELKKHHVQNLVLFPDSGKKFKTKGFTVLKTKSMKDAVAFAFKKTKKGAVCLLSCASPSYSLWKNFEEKGDQFQREVKSYRAK